MSTFLKSLAYMRLNWQFKKSFIIWIMIALTMCIAVTLFVCTLILPYTEGFPFNPNITGDAIKYVQIAKSFSSLADPFKYVGNRTYGYPLLLYIIKLIASPKTVVTWTVISSFVQFLIHILSCIFFYKFTLKTIFKKSTLPNYAAIFAILIIISYPAMITHTVIQTTDIFATDLVMLAASLYFMGYYRVNILLGFLSSTICGLLLGYAIMVRPSLYPPVIVLCVVSLLEAIIDFRTYRFKLIKVLVMSFAVLIPIMPTAEHFRQTNGIIAIQDQNFKKGSVKISLQGGLSHVRVYWSRLLPTSNGLMPGIKDPLLETNYGSKCSVNSLATLAKCLLSKPTIIPLYFGKKMIALFDLPFFQLYYPDLVLKTFLYPQRLFEVLAFCGFISLFISFVSRPFTQNKPVWIGLPWATFLLSLMFMQSLFHVEGRYGFPVIPFAIASLFLGYVGARQIGIKFFKAWISILIISGLVFLYQTHVWDLLPYT